MGVGQHGVEARQSQLTHCFTTALPLLYYMDLRQDSRAFWASGSLDLRGAVDMLIIFQLHRSDQVFPSSLEGNT